MVNCMANLTDELLFREDIDVDNHIIATYHLRHRQGEHKKVASAIAIGQSIGNPDVRTERDSPKLLENHLAKIIYLESEGAHQSEPTIAKIAFPLSNFGDEDVRQMALETKSGLLDIFLTQHHKLGISTTEEATMLSDMIDHSVFAMFRRSLNQTTINLLKETVSRIENVAEEKKTPKKFFNIL